MKKIILLLGICLLIICTVTACGGKESPEKAPPPAPQENQKTADSPKPPESPQEQEGSLADLFGKATNVEVEFDFTAVTPDAKVEGKQWIKGKKFRNEMAVEGEKLIFIVDFAKGESYNYIPAEKIAMKMDITEVEDMYQDPAEYLEDEDFKNAKIIESTTYEGLKCKVVFNKDADGTETKLWVWEEHGIPLRIEEADAEGDKTLVEFKNIKVGSLPDDLFELPAGVEIVDMGQLPATGSITN